MKKIVSLILMSLIVFSLSVFAEDSLSGEALKELGLIQGDGSGLNESGDITREAIVKMVVSLTSDLTEEFLLPETPTFSDVPKDHWAYSWVERAYAANLTKGVGNGLFGLGQKVTEQQVSAFMLNALNESYDYENAVEYASNKGLSTQVLEKFNRGNAFEMVSKTLLKTPVGQEKALFELLNNFNGKNYKEILENVEKEKAERAAAEEAKRKEEERRVAEALRFEKETMTKVRDSWPRDEETYIDWLSQVDEVLESHWQETTWFDFNKAYEIDYYTLDKDPNQRVRVDNRVDSKLELYHYDRNNIDQVLLKEEILSNLKVYVVEKYNTYKVVGTLEGKYYQLLFIKDTVPNSFKGYLKIDDDFYIRRITNAHPIVRLASEGNEELYNNFDAIDEKVLSLDDFKSFVDENITLDVSTNKFVKSGGINMLEHVGLDQYRFLLKDIKRGDTGQVTMDIEIGFDEVTTETVKIQDIEYSKSKNNINIFFWGRTNEFEVLILFLNENNEIQKAVMSYLQDSGIYIKE